MLANLWRKMCCTSTDFQDQVVDDKLMRIKTLSAHSKHFSLNGPVSFSEVIQKSSPEV